MPTPGYVFRDSGMTPPAEEESESTPSQFLLRDQHKPTQPIQSDQSAPSTKPTQSILSSLSPLSTRSTPQDKTTDSHALAQADHDIKGAAQIAGQSEDLTDLGWRAPPDEIDTLVGGLPNEELWTLVRRFNRVSKLQALEKASNSHALLTVQ
jgi:Protein of unknown function (DUF3292)